jgi:hypothetical protein
MVLARGYKLLLHVEPTTLYEAGWGIFSAAGRLACSKVFYAYVLDRLDDDPEFRSPFAGHVPDGRLGTGITRGVEWPLIVSEVWERCVDLATTVWYEHITQKRQTPGVERVTELNDAEWQRLLGTNRPGIQGDEARSVVTVIDRLLVHALTGRIWGAEPGEDGEEIAFDYDLRGILDRLTRRYQDSPLGTLDFSSFFNEHASEQLPAGTGTQGTLFARWMGPPVRERLEAGGDDQRNP